MHAVLKNKVSANDNIQILSSLVKVQRSPLESGESLVKIWWSPLDSDWTG